MILSKGTHVNEEGEVRRIGGDYESEEEIISSVSIGDGTVRAYLPRSFYRQRKERCIRDQSKRYEKVTTV